MTQNITRVFHPIGQGAFYSERHREPTVNIVYDCGSVNTSKLTSNIVKNSFQKKTPIDLLFISHFDLDHVSQIETLINEFSVKACVMPIVHENEKAILIDYYRSKRNKISESLLAHPEKLFSQDTKIIYVLHDKNENSDPIEFAQLKNKQEIKSGTPIKVANWIYVPYNENYSEMNKELEYLFLQNNLSYTEFKNNAAFSSTNRSKIKKIYTSLPRGINFNSMMVYSGPLQDNYKWQIRYLSNQKEGEHLQVILSYDSIIYLAGCIYTGDANLTNINLKDIFHKYWPSVGTIQIPHHGSLGSFDVSFLEGESRNFIFPVSYGKTNSYGHPSHQIIIDIFERGSIPIFINEDVNTIYVQKLQKLV